MGAGSLCVRPGVTQSIVCVLDFHLSMEKGHDVTALHPYCDEVTIILSFFYLPPQIIVF